MWNMKVYAAFILFVLLEINFGISETYYYNRSQLKEKYPGFGEDYVLFPGKNGEYTFGYLKHPEDLGSKILGIGDYDVEKDIKFILYTRNLPGGRDVTNVKELQKYFDKSKKTKFVTHGWMSSGKSDSCVTIKNGFLKTSDVNVLIMDWNAISGNIFYPIPMMATPNVGKHYAKFLNYLVNNMDANPKDFHLIGHSLGAHVSGFAGRDLKKGKVARITGLDPALPGFDVGLIERDRLNKDDSDFVDIIHTCAGFLGLKQPIGHVDFYPNGGGPPQPGCSILEIMEACSHGMSWKLFAESIVLDKPFMASECASFQLLWDRACDGRDIPMGASTPLNARGIYYIKTTGEEPFIKMRWNFIDSNDIDS